MGALSLGLYGCGQGFETRSYSDKQEFQSESDNLNDYLNDINAYPYDQETNQPAIPGDAGAEVGVVRYYADLDVAFDPIASGLGTADRLAKEQIWEDCKAGSNVDTSKNYKCGEAPMGRIVSQHRKEIMVVEDEGLRGKEKDVKYSVNGVKVPIYLSRHQPSGHAQIRRLDTRSTDKISIGSGLLDTVYFRLKPNGGTLETEICIFLPGIQVETDKASTRAKAEKKILWGATSLKTEGKLTVDFGQMSFDSGEFCTIFYAKTDENWQTKLDFKKLKAPVFKNLKYEGMKVDVDIKAKGLLKVINKILTIVGINLEKKAEKKAKESIKESIQDKAVEILEGDIKSGKWFYKKVNAEALLREALPKVEAQINNAFKYLGPSSENYLQTKFRRACEVAGAHLKLNKTKEFVESCKTNIRIKSHLFMKDMESEKLGCYNHFFRPEDTETIKSKWWARGCKIRNKIEIIATEEFAPFYHCVSKVLNATDSGAFDVGSCEYEIDLMLKATKDLKRPPVELLESFEDRIKNDPDFKKWEAMITDLLL